VGSVVGWPKHIRRQCNCSEGCGYCLGGLFTCATCNCSEGELPTDCPGFRVDYEDRQAIYDGLLNYRDGRWRAEDVTHAPRSRFRVTSR